MFIHSLFTLSSLYNNNVNHSIKALQGYIILGFRKTFVFACR